MSTKETAEKKGKKKKKKKGKKLDAFYYHEAIDRTDLIRSIIEDYLAKHPVIKKHPSFTEKVNRVQDILGDLYGQISNTQE